MVLDSVSLEDPGMKTFHAATAALIFFAPTSWSDDEPSRPNIVFILADDLGYGDLGCYDSPLAESPHIDQLAAEGTQFTQFYVSHCVCSPTRASAITGQFPSRHRIFGHLSFFSHNEKRNMPNWLDIEAPSLPRALQQAGYRTAMIGKWHLGGGSGRSFRISDLSTPGIDVSGRAEIVVNHPDAPDVKEYGFHYARTTVGNGPTWKHLEPWPEAHEVYPYLDHEWITFSSKAVVDDSIRFLNEHLEKHNDSPFYMNIWLKDVHTPHAPTSEMLEKFSELPEKERDHYAMVSYMDKQIGRLLNTMDRLGLREETLVLFSSDNGAGKNRGGSNGPLRGWKHTLYEGGIRVPLIVRWPGGGVPAAKLDDQSVLNVCDLVPTFAKLSGAQMPKDYESDGEDISSALRGIPFRRTKAQFWHYPTSQPSLAMRDGDWKLLMNLDGGKMEFYDLASDPSEEINMAKKRPRAAAEMKQQLQAWFATTPSGPIAASR